jgi:antitoxin component of RelBE/YafQ-DinJ toxin-antitoxin module
VAEQVLYGLGLVAAIVVAIFVTRIARRALRDVIPEAETGQPAKGRP